MTNGVLGLGDMNIILVSVVTYYDSFTNNLTQRTPPTTPISIIPLCMELTVTSKYRFTHIKYMGVLKQK